MHSIHIPVMGTGFTIDSALRLAPLGIDSVLSLVDDELIEQMREFHSRANSLEFLPISKKEDDYRAKRITAYLNLLNDLINDSFLVYKPSGLLSIEKLSAYVDSLPNSEKRTFFQKMLNEKDPELLARNLEEISKDLKPGSIDVNIMTKLNKVNYRGGEALPKEYNDACSALRGFANSNLSSGVVLSAGMNPSLYTYIAEFSDFLPNAHGQLKKNVILKVSDYRSALIQGKFLAKKGVWVSEFRIESGLNCGGHAFASDGTLLGPILEEFKMNRELLNAELLKICNETLLSKDKYTLPASTRFKLSAQGGVGEYSEMTFLQERYGVDSVGWGSIFLLVPEVVRIDSSNLERLVKCKKEDVFLSDASPLGVPFWNLKDSESEKLRLERIASGKAGSPCPKEHVRTNTEFSKKPICTGSSAYIRLKLEEINKDKELSEDLRNYKIQKVLAKSCICHDLAGGATHDLGIDEQARAAICPGPNIVYFKTVNTLSDTLSHIYGRSTLPVASDRKNMFLMELDLYLEYWKRQMHESMSGLDSRNELSYYLNFTEKLRASIKYYIEILGEANSQHFSGKNLLDEFKSRLLQIDNMQVLAKTHFITDEKKQDNMF